jgi:Na+-transporting NADH:ubiquinone oxidoreductase subunit NqrB
VLIASSFGFLKLLPYNGFDIILSAIVAVVICFIANLVFSKIFKAVTNNESVFITALILVLIFPVKFPLNFLPIIAISLLAMGSKYLLTVEKRHVFNPAAVAVLMLSYLSPEHSATWWIGTPIMFFPGDFTYHYSFHYQNCLAIMPTHSRFPAASTFD